MIIDQKYDNNATWHAPRHSRSLASAHNDITVSNGSVKIHGAAQCSILATRYTSPKMSLH